MLIVYSLGVPRGGSFVEDSVQRTIGSVVYIDNESCGWGGSGVAVTGDIIVTARHLVEDGNEFTITCHGGETLKAYQVFTSKIHDIGFVKVTEPKLTPVKFGSFRDCRRGQLVYSIGSTLGKSHMNAVAVGNVQTLNLDLEKFNSPRGYGWSILFSNTAEGGFGNSGCPLFTLDGVVRGIWVGSIQPNVHYCIPVDVFLADLEEIERMFIADKYK